MYNIVKFYTSNGGIHMEQTAINFNNITLLINNISKTLQIFNDNMDNLQTLINQKLLPESIITDITTISDQINNLVNYDFKKFIPEQESNSNQYIDFIKNKTIEFNSDYHLYNNNFQHSLTKFFDTIQNDFNEISQYLYMTGSILEFFRNIPEIIKKIKSFYNSLNLIDKFKDINDNIVLIGANGSGKSTLAREFKKTQSSNVILLSAQRIFYYKEDSSISNTGNELQELFSVQNNDKTSTDPQYINLINSDMENLMKALTSEHNKDALHTKIHPENDSKTILMKVTEIWNELNFPRQINIDKFPLYITNENSTYTFNELSDGEKAIFYYLGHVLSAKENSYIIIDEPETHLHPAICDTVWNRIEQEKLDCKFIYITHNLRFASNRNGTILWNKNFTPPYSWDFQILPKNEIFPTSLLLEVLGSKKNVCFCEGTPNSLDYKLYSLLLPKYNIIPIHGGHRDVISCVKSINNIQQNNNQFDNIPITIGIIDKDYHLDRQISKWEKSNIFTLPVNEVENILVDTIILEYIVDKFEISTEKLNQYYEDFWNTLKTNINEQVIKYVKNFIQHHISEDYLTEKKDLEILKSQLSDKIDKCDIDTLYDDKMIEINKMINEKNYESAIKFVDFKKFLLNNLAVKLIKYYPDFVMKELAQNSELREKIREKYFNSDIFTSY